MDPGASETNGKHWSYEEDLSLWRKRSQQTLGLAGEFKRTELAIKTRLRALGDPNHFACKRLKENGGIVGGGGGGGGGGPVNLNQFKMGGNVPKNPYA